MNSPNTTEAFRNQIEIAFREEQQHGKTATTLNDIPLDYERIHPDWWTAILCKNHPNAKVIAHRAELPDDLDRGHMRVWLTYNEAGTAASLPGSVFCKDSQKLKLRIFNSLCDTIRGEVTFYNQFRALIDNETPKCLFATYDPHSFNSIVVMDDLIPQGAEFCIGTTTITRERIESQLAYLARLHGKFYGKLDRYPELAAWRTFGDNASAYEKGLNMKEITHAGFLGSEHVIPPRLFVHHAEIWPATLKAIDLHRTRPNTYAHGDAHLRNWYITVKGDMALGDWQLTARSDWAFDVAYAISTSLTVENRRAWEKDLLKFYLDRLHAAGAPLMVFDETWNAYRKHLFTSLCWWTPVVRPASEQQLQPMDDTFEIIKRVATAIDDLDALSSFE